MKHNFTVTDLINAGLFTLLIFIATFAGAMIGIIPIFMPVVPFMCGLLSGPVFMLYSTKIKHSGMLLITAILLGLYFTLSGHGIYMLFGVVFFALLGEYFLKKGDYKNNHWIRWAYTVYSLSSIFNYLPLFLAREAYANDLIAKGYSQAFVEQLLAVLPAWGLIPFSLLGGVGAYLGCSLGIKLLVKHAGALYEEK